MTVRMCVWGCVSFVKPNHLNNLPSSALKKWSRRHVFTVLNYQDSLMVKVPYLRNSWKGTLTSVSRTDLVNMPQTFEQASHVINLTSSMQLMWQHNQRQLLWRWMRDRREIVLDHSLVQSEWLFVCGDHRRPPINYYWRRWNHKQNSL